MRRSTAAALLGLSLFLVFAAAAGASTPTISYTIDGIVGTNGWYRGSTHGDYVVVHWTVSLDATSTNCLAAVAVPGPTRGTTRSCWADNADGRTTGVTRVIRIDAIPPTGVAAHVGRKPDFHGWYNHPVAIRWTGADANSGIAHCTSATYRGPDSATATVNGGCTDRAGNTAARPVRLAYDATPPALHRVTEESTAGADVLSWISTSASDRILIRRVIRGRKARTTVFVGTGTTFADTRIHAGAQYVYRLRSIDEAGNVSKVVSIGAPVKILTLRNSRYVPLAAPNPILRWGRVRGAGYYNVQLFRGSKRIYSAWPSLHQVGLAAAWRWSGHVFRLTHGTYRWYVWAGFGPRRLAHYRAVGSARFRVPRT